MNADLWTAYEAAAATGGALCARGGDPDRWVAEEWAAHGLSIDTRTLKPGEMFVALADKRDGHDFLAAAFAKGASAALVARAPEATPEGAPLLIVRDTVEALRDLARAARRRNFGARIAVTGSAGKTSTKEMLRAALGAAGKVHAADKSFNNHLGVPLTLAELPIDADYGVFEIGMNHAGEIAPLSRLVRPHAVIITTVAEAHLENLGSLEGVADAKSEIFSGLMPGGPAILPIDNPQFPRLKRNAEAAGVGRIVTFGESPDADARLLRCADGAPIEARFFGRDLTFRLGAPGRHQALNALAALAAVELANAPFAPALATLEQFSAGAGRGLRRRITLPGGRNITLIDESYNANPASMRAALALLAAARGGRRIAVLGDMFELGPTAPELHASLAKPLAEAGVDRLYVAGALMRHLWEKVPPAMRGACADAASGLAETVLADVKDGDVVMVKGSNASKIGAVVAALTAVSAAADTPPMAVSQGAA